jgi:hypothetical protein
MKTLTVNLSLGGFSQIEQLILSRGETATYYLTQAVEYAINPQNSIRWDGISRYVDDSTKPERSISATVKEEHYLFLLELCAEQGFRLNEVLRYVLGDFIKSKYPTFEIKVGEEVIRGEIPLRTDSEYNELRIQIRDEGMNGLNFALYSPLYRHVFWLLTDDPRFGDPEDKLDYFLTLLEEFVMRCAERYDYFRSFEPDDVVESFKVWCTADQIIEHYDWRSSNTGIE